MRSVSLLQRAAALAVVSLFALAPGCGTEPELPGAGALRRSFPAHAARVLEGAAAFGATDEGFAAAAGSWGGVQVSLPRDGAGAIRFQAEGGFEVRVREVGAEGEGWLAERAVAYRRAGGTAYWTAAPGGPEEWLHLEAGKARAGEAVAAWEVEGGTLLEAGPVVIIRDDEGRARLRVEAPSAFTAGGRPVDVRLAVRSGRIELSVDAGDAGEELLVDPVWTAVASMSVTRFGATATLLASGKVLVAGGAAAASAEVYDSVANTWTATGAMNAVRSSHTATLLAASGKVLVAGGGATAAIQVSAETYDPVANTWKATPVMTAAHQVHTATALASGKVLLTGSSGASTAVDLYDPVLGTFSAGAPLETGRSAHAAALLQSGKVVVMGGLGAAGISITGSEVYDPATNVWTAVGALNQARQTHTATTLPGGKVLAAAGLNQFTPTMGQELATAELFDPVAQTWTVAASLVHFRTQHTATLLGNGGVLVAGDDVNSTSVELYEPATNVWVGVSSMNTGRYAHVAAVLADNQRVLVAGGPNLTSAELYTPLAQGAACVQAGDCVTGFCVDGVCCNTACSAGACDACSVAAGGAKDGTCALLTGTACNDGNACTQTDTCQAGVCTGGNPVVCGALDQCHTAGVCTPATGVCSNPLKANGAVCSDGNGCTQTDTCQAGVCTGANPVVCAALDACHTAGVCAPATGVCSNPPVANGTACNDGNACTQADSCQAGVCTGANPVVCGALDQCHTVGVCAPATGVCSNPPAANGAACNDGNACTQADSCQAGVCTGANPVVCGALDQCHTAGVCAPATGVCSNPPKANGAVCSDGNGCTQTDTCQAGVCTGANPVVCAALDACHTAGVCAPGTGVCSNPPVANGTACNDGNACTQADSCQAGVCTGANPVVCGALDQCHTAGVCAPATGVCSNPLKANGAVCSDGNGCTQTDTCQAGVCTGANPVVCGALDQCHTAGVCAPATGMCSNPPKADGAVCNDGSACTQTDTCQAGVCAGANAVVCPAPDQCHTAGACDATTGTCSNPVKADGTTCDDGSACTQMDTCQAGACAAGNPVVCPVPDQCHTAGACDAATGMCSNPPAADGTACDDGSACTQTDTCQAGACTGASPVVCPAPDQCHTAGACDATTGVCSNPVKPDGAACDDGQACTTGDTCKAGACAAGPMVDCTAAGPCENDGACDPTSGTCAKSFKPDGTACPGGGVCTAGVCEGGQTGTGGSTGSVGSTGSGTSSTSTGTSAGTTGAGGAAGAGGAGAGSGTTGSGGGTTSQHGGCGCTTAGAPASGASWLLLGLVAALRVRRSRRR